MNLHGLVSGVIAAVNPIIPCQLKSSTGFKVVDHKQVATWATFANVPCQIQPLSNTDLRKMDGLNLQGIARKIFLNGNVEGVNRAAIKGGDLFRQPDGTVWLVTQPLENWPDWSSVAVTQQVGGWDAA